MRTNRTLLAIAALSVTALALVGVVTAVSPGAGADHPTERIEVGASGEVSTAPDQALLRIGVVATAADAPTARDRVAANVTALRSTLTELGVPDDRIRTAYYDIGEVRDRPETEGPTEYRGVHAFEITLTDTERVGPVIDGVVDSGANRVEGVSFTLSEDRRRTLRQQALRNAMANARAEAETLGDSANLTVDGAASISTNDVSVSPYRVEQVMTADAGGGSTAIESGPVDVSASVQVVYNATAQ